MRQLKSPKLILTICAFHPRHGMRIAQNKNHLRHRVSQVPRFHNVVQNGLERQYSRYQRHRTVATLIFLLNTLQRKNLRLHDNGTLDNHILESRKLSQYHQTCPAVWESARQPLCDRLCTWKLGVVSTSATWHTAVWRHGNVWLRFL